LSYRNSLINPLLDGDFITCIKMKLIACWQIPSSRLPAAIVCLTSSQIILTTRTSFSMKPVLLFPTYCLLALLSADNSGMQAKLHGYGEPSGFCAGWVAV